MGDETVEFASRFSLAMHELTQLAGGAERDRRAKRPGPEAALAVRAALDAVEAVYATGTQAFRNWPEQRKRVLAQIAAMREALGRSGIDDRLRAMARALLELVEPRSTGG